MKKYRSTLEGRQGAYDKMHEVVREAESWSVEKIAAYVSSLVSFTVDHEGRTKEHLLCSLSLSLAKRIIDAA